MTLEIALSSRFNSTAVFLPPNHVLAQKLSSVHSIGRTLILSACIQVYRQVKANAILQNLDPRKAKKAT